MSEYPCGNCRHTNNGRLKYAYITYFEGEETLKRRLRVCLDCFHGLLDDALAVSERQDSFGRWLAAEEQV